MDGKKVVIMLFAIVIITGIITFSIYLLTRQENLDDEGVAAPNAVQEYQAIASHIVL